MRSFAAAAAVVVVALVVSGAHAEDDRLARLFDWLAAVRAHEPGVADEPLKTVAAWNNSAIRELWLTVQTLLEVRGAIEMRRSRPVLATCAMPMGGNVVRRYAAIAIPNVERRARRARRKCLQAV